MLVQCNLSLSWVAEASQAACPSVAVQGLSSWWLQPCGIAAHVLAANDHAMTTHVSMVVLRMTEYQMRVSTYLSNTDTLGQCAADKLQLK